MLPSMLPRLATDSAVRVFPGIWKFLSFLRLLSWVDSPSLPLLSLFVSFIFFPTSFRRQWAAFLGAWCPLLAFRSCFVEFTQRSNVLLMNLWERKWSPRPIPPCLIILELSEPVRLSTHLYSWNLHTHKKIQTAHWYHILSIPRHKEIDLHHLYCWLFKIF